MKHEVGNPRKPCTQIQTFVYGPYMGFLLVTTERFVVGVCYLSIGGTRPHLHDKNGRFLLGVLNP